MLITWQCAWEYRHLFQIMILFPLDIYLEAGLLYRVVVLLSISCTLPHCFPLWLCQYTFPPAAHKGSPFSTSASVALVAKNSPASAGDIKRGRFNPWVRKIPCRKKWQPTPVFLPGESLGRRSLVGYSPWGCKRVRHGWATEHACTHDGERVKVVGWRADDWWVNVPEDMGGDETKSSGGGQGLGLSSTGQKGKRQKCVGMQWSSCFVVVIVVQLPSWVWLWNPMDHSTPGFPDPHHIPEFAQVHVRWISDAIQPFHPLSPSSPSPFNLCQHQGLCQWVGCSCSPPHPNHFLNSIEKARYSLPHCAEVEGKVQRSDFSRVAFSIWTWFERTRPWCTLLLFWPAVHSMLLLRLVD